MKQAPARLHVIPATGCDMALILRRGPTDAVASLLWDRRTGTLEMGQWLRGRIYEHRSDLSPDARHMVIFARRAKADLAWTAVSRAPWLTALIYAPQEHMWQGGGAFDATGRFWQNGASPRGQKLPDGLSEAPATAFPHATDGFHMGDLYAAKMALRGWVHRSGTRYDLVMTKPLDHGWDLELSIQLSAKNRSSISDRYALVHVQDGLRHDQPDWEWADLFEGALQFAARGCLHHAQLTSAGDLQAAGIVQDLNGMSFEMIEAPYTGVSDRGGAP